MAEHEAAMDHNWLQSYLIESIDKRLCTNIDCTTCGAHPFRHGLLDAVPRATDQPRPPRLDRKEDCLRHCPSAGPGRTSPESDWQQGYRC